MRRQKKFCGLNGLQQKRGVNGSAFTLAEGLIVVATIGVAAALLTIPAYLNKKEVSAGSTADCIVKLGDSCINKVLAPDKDYKPLTKTECEQIVNAGELGIKTCKYDKDYWAGAVKACGGTDKMLTMKQLGELAGYFYNYSGTIKPKQDIDDEKGYKLDVNASKAFLAASPYGAKLNEFYIWSGEEDSSEYAYTRYFLSNGTYYFENARELATRLAVCIE